MHIHWKPMTTKQLKEAIRHGPYSWPGGYPIYFVTEDGGALSYNTVKQEYKRILYSVRHNDNDGWRVIGADVNWEETELLDDHTGERIESAYGDD